LDGFRSAGDSPPALSAPQPWLARASTAGRYGYEISPSIPGSFAVVQKLKIRLRSWNVSGQFSIKRKFRPPPSAPPFHDARAFVGWAAQSMGLDRSCSQLNSQNVIAGKRHQFKNSFGANRKKRVEGGSRRMLSGTRKKEGAMRPRGPGRPLVRERNKN